MFMNETASLMLSTDYKDRFIAEYVQLTTRYRKLLAMLHKWEQDELDFEPTCPNGMYREQIFHMGSYLNILEKRAKLENIQLPKVD